MTRRHTRRAYLRAAAAAGLGGVAGCAAPVTTERGNDARSGRSATARSEATARGGSSDDREGADEAEEAAASLDPVDVRGALYVPARAWNTFQMWHDYDEGVIERDLGYADAVNLNAIRTWVSYEQWQNDPEALERAVDHFLAAADDRGMEVLFGLFESVGKEPTDDHLYDTDPVTAPPVQSPSSSVLRNEFRWDGPREYVRWFMERYGDDDRLLAIEVMNEPGWLDVMKNFAAGMFETMVEHRGSVPLTVGSTSMANNAEYVDWGADVLQLHYNFPSSEGKFHDLLPQALQLGRDLDMPVYLSEWQRIADFGWDETSTVDDWEPDYASIAPAIHEHGVGNFFWSLMVKPAYVRYMRRRGIVNGLFHEDGTVWNAADARAIKAMSGDPEVDVEQRREWPAWAAEVKRHAFENEE